MIMKYLTSILISCAVLMSLMTGQVNANIIEVKDFRMQQMTLVNKYRFVFSDFEDENVPLKNAKIKFDLSAQPVASPNHTLVLFIIEADEDGGKLLLNTLKSGDANGLIYADHIVHAVKPIKDKLTIVD